MVDPYGEYLEVLKELTQRHDKEVQNLKYDRYVWAAWSAAITLLVVVAYIYIKFNH